MGEMSSKAKLKWKDTKIISVLILFATIILVFLIYGDTYHLTGETEILSAAISDYIPDQRIKAEIELTYKEGDWMYIIFSDSQYGDCFMGLALLKRGWNGRYVIRSTQYGSGPVVRMDMKPNDKNHVILYGLIQDGLAVRYEYTKSVQDIYSEVMYQGNIDKGAFFHVQENKGNWVTSFRLFDGDGKDVTENYLNRQRRDALNGTVATAELFMVDVQCIVILLVGSGLAISRNRTIKSRNIQRKQ